jgi:hypothetical protein
MGCVRCMLISIGLFLLPCSPSLTSPSRSSIIIPPSLGSRRASEAASIGDLLSLVSLVVLALACSSRIRRLETPENDVPESFFVNLPPSSLPQPFRYLRCCWSLSSSIRTCLHILRPQDPLNSHSSHHDSSPVPDFGPFLPIFSLVS